MVTVLKLGEFEGRPRTRAPFQRKQTLLMTSNRGIKQEYTPLSSNASHVLFIYELFMHIIYIYNISIICVPVLFWNSPSSHILLCLLITLISESDNSGVELVIPCNDFLGLFCFLSLVSALQPCPLACLVIFCCWMLGIVCAELQRPCETADQGVAYDSHSPRSPCFPCVPTLR